MNPNFASFIRVLANVQSFEDVQRDMSVTAFLTTKYSVTLSNKTFHYLMRYLQQQQVIYFKIRSFLRQHNHHRGLFSDSKPTASVAARFTCQSRRPTT